MFNGWKIGWVKINSWENFTVRSILLQISMDCIAWAIASVRNMVDEMCPGRHTKFPLPPFL